MSLADPIKFLDLASALDAAAPPSASKIADVIPYAGLRPTMELELWSDESTSLTGVQLLGAVPRALADAAVAATTFTVADQPTGKLTATGHSYTTGDGPVSLTTTGALPGGLSTTASYWIRVVDANTIQFFTSLEAALLGTAPVVLSSNGTGTNRVAVTTTATLRLRWLSLGKLGLAADGAVTLGYSLGYRYQFQHAPAIVAYALIGVVASGKVSADIYPQNPIAV